MVNDLNNTHYEKHKLALQTSKSLDNFSDKLNYFPDNQTNPLNNPIGITFPPPFCTKRPNKIRMTRFKLFPKRQLFSQLKTNYRTSTFRSSQELHPTLPNYPTANTTQNDILVTPNDNSVDNTPVNDDTDSPIKIYSKTNYPFSPPSFRSTKRSAPYSNIERLTANFNSLYLPNLP